MMTKGKHQMKTETDKCAICETNDADLIRTCELRGLFTDCLATRRPAVPRELPPRRTTGRRPTP